MAEPGQSFDPRGGGRHLRVLQRVLADLLTGTFGVEWDTRDRGKDRNVVWEIAGIGEDLVAEFSSRSRAIEIEKSRLVEEYVARHGRRPPSSVIIRLRAQATLTTRPAKQVCSLAELTEQWRARATAVLGDATWWASTITGGGARPTLRADDIPLDVIGEVGRSVVAEVSQQRATWRHWNLWAEASRQTMGWRFASVQDRETVVGMVVEAAAAASLPLTPPRAGDQSDRLPPRRRQQPIPAPALGRLLLNRTAGRKTDCSRERATPQVQSST